MFRSIDRLWIGRKLALLAGDVLVFLAVAAMVLTLRDAGPVTFSLLAPFLPVLVFGVIAAYAAGLYELRLIRDFVSLVGGLLASGGTSAVFGSTYFYLLSSYVPFAPKVTLLLIVLGTQAGMFIWRRVMLSATGFGLMDLSILVLADPSYVGDLKVSAGRRANEEFHLVQDVSHDVDVVVVDRAWTDRHAEASRKVLSGAIALGIPIVSINEFHESLFGKVAPHHARDLAWALDHVLPRSGSLYFTAKRVSDFLTAAVMLLMLAPAMALVAIAITVVDRVPPFFVQKRVGYLGRPFSLWKFRTMRTDADRNGPFIQVQERQLQVTALGAVLRRLRIDELPQLWNVLKGEMSLVGPRPEWIREVEVLEKTIPTYSLRYLVPPGITGWAQVYFRATNTPEDSVEKHNYDLYYLKHFSLSLDFSILLKTVKRTLIKDSRISSSPTLSPGEAGRDAEVSLDIASIVDRSV
jgi:lipopolysaccharide/colanic/teichoic acid biosynthesis glycosyltransferase